MEQIKINVGCCLEASHNIPELPWPDEPLNSPEGLRKMKEIGDQRREAEILWFRIPEAKAQAIVDRLWPGHELLCETWSGYGFRLKTPEQIQVVNEVLAPEIRISFNPEKHTWFLQTWPETV